MEESNDERRVIPELYFLIAKFLSGGPLKETAKTLLKELESIEVLPRRVDWEGQEHTQTYDELASQYSDVSWRRLVSVCERALSLARRAPAADSPASTASASPSASTSASASASASGDGGRLAARLSLLSEALVRPNHRNRQDHTLVRRLVGRELGVGPAAAAGGRCGRAMFPARMLAGLTLQRRTLGHLSAVYCLVFDCTGRYVITGADDMLVKVWSAVDGRLVATLRGVGAEITDVCVSADNALVACGSVDRLVRVWCLATGEPRAVLAAHAGTITSVHWAPPARRDVRWLASTSTDCSVAFWTCSPEGQFLSQPVQYVERMRPGVCHMICAAWSAGGAFLAAGSADHHVRIYTVEHEPGGPKRVLETPVHDDAVDSIAWAHRGLRFVSGSKDGSAALWTLHATQWRHVLLQPRTTHTDGKRLKMTMVCWDRSDSFVVTAASDSTVRVWCARSGSAVRTLRGHRDEAYVLEAHPFLPHVFLSAGHDGQLLVWDATADEPLASFHNTIDGHGDGAIFDAKWGGACTVAATDSHGHLLLLGLGRGHRLFSQLPTELFFHTDYRPVVLDALGGAHDEQTDTPPHLLPPPFLVDVEGAPHAPEHQRLVPGRENLALAQLIPAAEAPRSRIDAMLEALGAAAAVGGGGGGGGGRGVWRGEGVRFTAGSWQRGDPLVVPAAPRAIVPPPDLAALDTIAQAAQELNALEQAWYRREMRRRPVMISTAPDGGGPRRKAGRRARGAGKPPAAPSAPAAPRDEPPEPESASCSDTSDEWLQQGARAGRSTPDSHNSSLELSDTDSSSHHSGSKSDSSSSSSQYSDWEAGAALAPPARARRRPLPTNRYSPSTVSTKRAARAPPPARSPGHSPDGAGHSPDAAAAARSPSPDTAAAPAAPPDELPDAYRPGEWLTAVSPRKAPYHPQMGDQCLYFRLGHQRYFEAVAEKDVYKVNPRDKPWERAHVYECEVVKVVGIKYVIKPPRVASLRLACALDSPEGGGGGGGGGGGRFITVRYHDMADVIDFLVLRQQYDTAIARRWGAADRFRCMIDDCWWTGQVLENSAGDAEAAGSALAAGLCGQAAHSWAAHAAAQFLSLRVRWDNGEVERLSPWDLEPLDPERLPSSPGGAVPVLPHELEAVLYRASPDEWPPRGERAAACRAIAQHVGCVMSLSAAEAFSAPVDLARYPLYARVVPYPIDLATVRARCQHLWYRRAAAAQFDARCLASNAERFNEPHSGIVRAARLLTDLLLHIIAHWRDVDVLAKYRELAQAYHSSDEEPPPPAPASSRTRPDWREACNSVLTELMASADAEPFRQPVSVEQAPDYGRVVSRRMDLGTVRTRLTNGEYSRAEHFASDVRLVFSNSRLYNTNKRSRIYSMTVRLSALFEALWSRCRAARTRTRTRTPRAPKHPRPQRAPRATRRTRRTPRKLNNVSMNGETSRMGRSLSSVSSESETLAARSRRVLAARDSWDSDAPLHVHTKGKGVGKKSKSSSASASAEPRPSTSRHVHVNGSVEGEAEAEGEGEAASSWAGSGSGASASSSASSTSRDNIHVVEEELRDDEVEITYDTDHRREHSGGTSRARSARKRRLASSDSSAHTQRRSHRRRKHNKHTPVKRTRERFTEASTSSSSCSEASGPEAQRYESDRSYHPRYSSDDDAPLQLYRSRPPGPSPPAPAPAPVSLRARRARRYNEDSEEDSVAAISKRLQHHHHSRTHHAHAARRRRHHAEQSASAEGSASASHTSDHNYYNGHAAHNGDNGDNGAVNGSSGSQSSSLTGAAGPSGLGPSGAGPSAVSISSRGRVRKLTAKARGLLRE